MTEPEPVDFGAARLAQALRDNAPQTARDLPDLRAAVRQAVASPGKLLRARLAYAAARSHGLPAHASEHLACAIEYFHTASLLFDDLPCMDDATLRRGLPCAHRVHGEATTILAALALINRAHTLLGFAFAAQSAAIRIAAQCCVEDCLGLAGLAGGQERDLRFHRAAQTAREVSSIALAKTGALFRLTLVLPALAGRLADEELRILKALAIYAGLLFQAEDDLRDVLGSEAELGKNARRDRVLARPNLALVLGVAPTRARLLRLSDQIGAAVERLLSKGPQWSYLVTFQTQAFQSARVQAA